MAEFVFVAYSTCCLGIAVKRLVRLASKAVDVLHTLVLLFAVAQITPHLIATQVDIRRHAVIAEAIAVPPSCHAISRTIFYVT